MTEKFEINILEENQIEFGLKIEGSDSEVNSVKPKVRFTITEEKTGKGWFFLTEKNNKNGNFVATIPVLKGVVAEGGKYNGKLEIILGNKYFTPTEVDIQFVEPLKVESVIVSNNKPLNKKESTDDLLIESVIIQKPKTEYKDLSEANKAEVNKRFLKKCSEIGIKNPLRALKEGTQSEKDRLKSLLDVATKEFLDD